ncbi:hypothetical protein [Corynebacterium stationis]|uniref:hypothetical protein n=1 Tax=Corynebacterium stationis TaxID=1705 RepID=UPI00242FC37D|nr:hypothetical protein [Corynebacterium stationis]MDO5508143.1 hypothetical protein [Corynebacterium casei]WLP87775.1 hypothetical protein Q9G90_03590 [Corynebacterium stationis]
MQVDKKYLIRLNIAFLIISVALGGLVATGEIAPIVIGGAVWLYTVFNVIKYNRAYDRQLQEISTS